MLGWHAKKYANKVGIFFTLHLDSARESS